MSNEIGMTLKQSDIIVLREMAATYGMDTYRFLGFARPFVRRGESGKRIKTQRQFRVTESEYLFIAKKATERGVGIPEFVRLAVRAFLQESRPVDLLYSPNFSGGRTHDEPRSKIIALTFATTTEDDEFVAFSRRIGMFQSKGIILRFCALSFNGKKIVNPPD